MLPTPRAILFDWDNTLVNTWPIIHTALNMTLRHMDHQEWTYERVRAEVKQSMRDSFPLLFGERWKDAAKHYQTSYRAIHLEELAPLSQAEAMLASIPRPEIFVGVVSNKMGSTLRKEIAHLGWEGYFDVAIGAGDAARDKPHPDPVLLALQGSGIHPSPALWFVGDTAVDLEVAQAVGATPVLYGEVATTASQLEGFPFAAHVHNHHALQTLIQSPHA